MLLLSLLAPLVVGAAACCLAGSDFTGCALRLLSGVRVPFCVSVRGTAELPLLDTVEALSVSGAPGLVRVGVFDAEACVVGAGTCEGFLLMPVLDLLALSSVSVTGEAELALLDTVEVVSAARRPDLVEGCLSADGLWILLKDTCVCGQCIKQVRSTQRKELVLPCSELAPVQHQMSGNARYEAANA